MFCLCTLQPTWVDCIFYLIVTFTDDITRARIFTSVHFASIAVLEPTNSDEYPYYYYVCIFNWSRHNTLSHRRVFLKSNERVHCLKISTMQACFIKMEKYGATWKGNLQNSMDKKWSAGNLSQGEVHTCWGLCIHVVVNGTHENTHSTLLRIEEIDDKTNLRSPCARWAHLHN